MGRELTDKEKKIIAQSVIRQCANYDRDYDECLPLESDCYMMNIGYTDSRICKYYENAVLPKIADVIEILQSERTDVRVCGICGLKFIPRGTQLYCSSSCAYIARKKANAKRVRKHRENKARM